MSEHNEFSEESLRKLAAQRIKFRSSVSIHLVFYIFVNIILFSINFITVQPMITFQTSWFLYPLLGWLIGLIMHALSYILVTRSVYPLAKRGIYYHLTAYLTVMVLLIVNNLQIIPGYLWVLWPGIFWGIGVIGHIVIYFTSFEANTNETGKFISRKEQAIEREMEKLRKKKNSKTQ